MRAIILAGGKGTRLRPLTLYTPKPIVPLVNRPFLLFQFDLLSTPEISAVTLSLNYQPDKIAQVLGDGSDFGVDLSFVTEPQPLGTAGAFRFACAGERDAAIVLNGDILTDVDLSDVVEFHKSTKSDATLVLARVNDPSRYGLVEVSKTGEIQRFLEKPKPEEISGLGIDTINAGIYILEPAVIDLIPADENCSFEYHVFPRILERKMRFSGFILESNYWRDIGNPASYLEAHHDFLSGRIKGFSPQIGSNAQFATAAHVDRKSVIGESCIIKPHASVINSVIGAGVSVGEKSIIENSVVWPHTRIAESAIIRDAIIGRNCHIGKSVSVGVGSVLGDRAMLPDYSKV